MRVALISDIHANLVALEAVLGDLKADSIDHVVCLGDVATSGPNPHEVIAGLRDLRCHLVMGNMDRWLLAPPPQKESISQIREIQFWGLKQLQSDQLEYLRSFQPVVSLPVGGAMNLLCYHGTPQSNERGISPTTADEEIEQMLAGHHGTVLAGGHTHRQMLRRHGGVTILNPGTVGAPMPDTGQSRETMWAEYAVVASADGALRFEFRRAPMVADAVVESVHGSGIPHAEWWLSLRYGPSRPDHRDSDGP